MTADCGYLNCTFYGSQPVMEQLMYILSATDRQNTFSCGLSWLDEVDTQGEVESEAVSYDTLAATFEFLTQLLSALPDLRFEGRIEHRWPILPCKQTVVEFSTSDGALLWNEYTEAPEPELPEDFFPDIDDEEEIEIPLTPYD